MMTNRPNTARELKGRGVIPDILIETKFEDILDITPFVVIAGKVQRDGEMVNLIVQSVRSLFQEDVDLDKMRVKSRDFH